MSIACLPWYDFEETRPYTDQLWFSLVARLTDAGFAHVPSRLLREVDHDEILAHPDLLLSQTCGYVAVSEADYVELVATPWYAAPGCSEANYRSHIVVRDETRIDDLSQARGLHCAVNEAWSHSGLNGLRTLVAPMHEAGRFFGSVTRTGSHLASLERIRAGDADIASIDCVTWELVRKHRSDLLQNLRIISSTPLAPAPPFVTAATSTDALVFALKEAIDDVLADPKNEELCEALMLEGVEHLEMQAYEGMLIDAQRAHDAGYTEMSFSET